MTSALAAGEFALALTKHGFFRDNHSAPPRQLLGNTLALVRRAAQRMHTIAVSDSAISSDCGEALNGGLRDATSSLSEWIADVSRNDTLPTITCSFFLTLERRTLEHFLERQRTWVLEAAGRLVVSTWTSRSGISDSPGTYQELRWISLTSKDLRNASFVLAEEEGEDRATPSLDIRLDRPVIATWLTVPPPDCRELLIWISGPNAVRGGAQSIVRISCDTEHQVNELAGQLRGFGDRGN